MNINFVKMASRMIITLSLCCLLSAAPASAEESLNFAIGDWQPYTGENMAGHGMAAEIVTAACRASSLSPAYSFFPWKRAVEKVTSAEFFGTFPYKEIPERIDNYVFSDTLFSTAFGILVSVKNTKTEGFEYHSPTDFKGYKVGIVSGTDSIKIPLAKHGVTIQEIPTAKQNLKKLARNRIDFYIGDKAVISEAMKADFSAEERKEFAYLKTDFGEKNDWKIMISKQYPNHQAMIEKLNQGLAEIKASGMQKKILEKYGL